MTAKQMQEVERALPSRYPVAVVMERRPSSSPWQEESWEAVGITAGDAVATGDGRMVKIHEDGNLVRFLHGGFELRLYDDECESYYHNLMTPHPRAYVVARPDEEEVPQPFLVSLSFDEAHAYLEAGEVVYAVDIPPEIYRWCEAFVLARYRPERKYKRKLDHSLPARGGRR